MFQIVHVGLKVIYLLHAFSMHLVTLLITFVSLILIDYKDH